MNEDSIDRSVIRQASLEESDAEDVCYWMSLTPAERIAGIERLRRWIYGDAAIDAGLQRVLAAVELGAD